jgi:hypothetical protein
VRLGWLTDIRGRRDRVAALRPIQQIGTALDVWYRGLRQSQSFLQAGQPNAEAFREEFRQLSLIYDDYSNDEFLGLRQSPAGKGISARREHQQRLLGRCELGFEVRLLSVGEIRSPMVLCADSTPKLPFMQAP